MNIQRKTREILKETKRKIQTRIKFSCLDGKILICPTQILRRRLI